MIHILTTGGTIEGLDYKDESFKNLDSEVTIRKLLLRFKIDYEYSIKQILSKDSRFIDELDREFIAKEIKTSKVNKILITHGTYTMVETAQYLAKSELNKVIVLTGAFILGTEESTDAPFNLEFALDTLSYLNKGVYIAMHGRIFYWDNVRKNVEQNRFETLSE